MDLIKIAYKNVRDSLSLYRLYIVSMIFSVVIFYQFVNMNHNPVMQAMKGSDFVGILAGLGMFVMMVFVVFFLFFSNNFYITERKKEIGLYVLVGTTPKKIGLMIAIENMMIYFLATIIGVISGVLFSKLFMMITAKFLNLGMTIDFYISIEAIINSFLTFMVLGVLTSINSYFRIRRKKIIELLKGKSMEDRMPSANVIVGVISFLIIASGYWCSGVMNNENLLYAGLGAIVLVIIGTFLFYRSIMTMILRGLIKYKSFIYRNNRILIYSALMHRIGKNYKVFAAVTIFLACTLTAFSTSASFKYGIDDMAKVKYPYTISWQSYEENDLYEKIEANILSNDGVIGYSNKDMPFYTLDNVKLDVFSGTSSMDIIAYETYKKNVLSMDYRTKEAVLYDQSLEDNECLYINPGSSIMTIGSISEITIDSDIYEAMKSIKAPLFGGNNDAMIVNQTVFESLQTKIQTNKENKEQYYYASGFRLENADTFIPLHQSALEEMAKVYDITLRINQNTISYDTDTLFVFIQLFFVIGIFLTLAFIMATGSIIYFRIASDARDEKKTYRLLIQMGLEDRKIKGIIYRQNLMFFVFPMVIAFCHSYFASLALERFMGISLLVPMLFSALAISALFFIYYIITIQKYKQVVFGT